MLLRKFGPKPKIEITDVRTQCPACHQHFVEGDYTVWIILGPGDNEEERRKRDEYKPYNAVSIEVHWDCSRGVDK